MHTRGAVQLGGALVAVLLASVISYNLGLSQAVKPSSHHVNQEQLRQGLAEDLKLALSSEVRKFCVSGGPEAGLPPTSWRIIADTSSEISTLRLQHDAVAEACEKMSGETIDDIKTSLDEIEEAVKTATGTLETLTNLRSNDATKLSEVDAAVHTPCDQEDCKRPTVMERLDEGLKELKGDGEGPISELSGIVAEMHEIEKQITQAVNNGNDATELSKIALAEVWNQLQSYLVEAVRIDDSEITARKEAGSVLIEFPRPDGFASCEELTLIVAPELSEDADAAEDSATQTLRLSLAGGATCTGTILMADDYKSFDLSENRRIEMFMLRKPSGDRLLEQEISE